MADERRRVPTVHQALHGYAEGHRLLASSLKLPREADRAMLMLSDLPGQVLCEGFETYISGYPLPGTTCFVLARTWYAAEMPRPGCVWTHSLLVPEFLLAQVRRPSLFVTMLRRPTAPDDFRTYRDPLDAGDVDQGAPKSRGAVGVVPVDLLAEVFYRFPSRPVIVPLAKAADAEAAFLGLWDGQWESLRRSFTFCTGSSASREVSGSPFSLQGVPVPELNRVSRAIDAVVATVRSPHSTDVRDDWLDIIVRDLQAPGDGPFVEFLRGFDGHLPGNRVVARPLAEMFSLLRAPVGRPEIRRLLRIMADAFPEADECAELKADLLGPSNSESSLDTHGAENA